MNILGVIPARYASTRFPGKPLVMINGLTMIERVYVQASKSSSIKKVIVATDDEKIVDAVKAFGGNVVITSATHRSGTDRCAEVLEKEEGNWEVVINIQGDEPFIEPGQIDLLASCFSDTSVQIATLIKKISNLTELSNPNTPKVIVDHHSNAIYFSRQAIPYIKGFPFEQWLDHSTFYKHIGIYAYRAETLNRLVKFPLGKLEKVESLEQLRWIENGFTIRTAITEVETSAIDTPEDLAKILAGNVR